MRSRLCSRRLHVSYQAWCEHRRAGLTERRCSQRGWRAALCLYLCNQHTPTWGIFLETRRAVEEYVKQSGMTYTILRPNHLMDLWLGPGVDFHIANSRVQIFGSGEGKINWVALGDVLQFAVQALDHPAAHNATLELNGPNWLSQTNCCVKRSSPKRGFLAAYRYTTFGMVSK